MRAAGGCGSSKPHSTTRDPITRPEPATWTMLVRIIQFVRLLIILASRLEVSFSRTWRCGDRVPKGRYPFAC